MNYLINSPLILLCSASFAESATAFNLSDPIVTGGSNSSLTAGTNLTYLQADPDNLYDVVVNVESVINPLATTSPNTFTDPRVVDGTDVTSGLFLTRWDWDDDALEYSNQQLSMTFNFEVYLAGTDSLATGISLIASSFDNDGATQNSATVREFVIYSAGAEFTSVGVTQTLANTNDDRTAYLGPATVEPGITDDPDYVVEATYENQSSFTWRSGHLVTGLAPDADPGLARLGALQLSFEQVPEPSSSLLVSLAGLSLLTRRRRV